MKIVRVIVIIAFMMGLVMAVQPFRAQAQGGGALGCEAYAAGMTGTYSAYTGSTAGSYGPFEGGVYTFTFESIDAVGATVRLVADEFGAVTLAGPSSLPVTFTFNMPSDPAEQPIGLGFYFDSGNEGSVSLTVTCVPAAAGCDTLVDIPPQAAMGTFTSNAETFWAPGQVIVPATVVEAGKSYLVAGQDETGAFRKVLIACQWVWVRAETVGPTFSPPWNGTPLPTDVVE